MSAPVTYVYGPSDFAFDLFMATVAPSDLSEYEWRIFQAAKRDGATRFVVVQEHDRKKTA